MARRHIAATTLGVVAGISFNTLHFIYKAKLAPFEQTAGIVAGAFGFVVNAVLLWEIMNFDNADLGKISHARNTLILSLILICCAVPYTLFTTFSDVVSAPLDMESASPLSH